MQKVTQKLIKKIEPNIVRKNMTMEDCLITNKNRYNESH